VEYLGTAIRTFSADGNWLICENSFRAEQVVEYAIPVSTGAEDVYAVTYSYPPATLYTNFIAVFETHQANVGTTPTLNVNSLGAKTIKKDKGTALAASDITSGELIVCIYDGTDFQLLYR